MKKILIAWEKWKTVANRIYLYQARVLLLVFYFLVIVPFGLAQKFITREKPYRRTSWESKDQGLVSDPDMLARQ